MTHPALFRARVLIVFAAMSAVFSAPAAQAATIAFSGRELLAMCTSASDMDYGYCAGYVTAIANTMLDAPVAGLAACNHASVKSQQLIDIYTRYADLFPETMSGEASAAVAASLARAFPCGKK